MYQSTFIGNKFDTLILDQLEAVCPGGKMPQLIIQQLVTSPNKTYLVYEIYLNQDLFPSLTSVNVYTEKFGSSELQAACAL